MKFNLEWRVPCTIYFIRRKITQYHDIKGKQFLTLVMLCEDTTFTSNCQPIRAELFKTNDVIS